MHKINKGFNTKKWIVGICFAVLACQMAAAQTDIECKEQSLLAGSTLNIRIDNDLFGGERQDQGYTNGFLVTMVSPNLTNYLDDPCLHPTLKQINKHLAWLHPRSLDELNMTTGIGQAIFTPKNKGLNELSVNDRPYAAALMASVGYNARRGNQLRSSQIRLGVVGPAALGASIQNEWHRFVGVERFRGWNNQLGNEPVIQLIHERHLRWSPEQTNNSNWGWDVISHVGGSVGNFATYANAGVEWRFGYRIPNDFGTAPLHTAGENTTPLKNHAGRHSGLSGHAFLALDARWVLRDITLDGNTFRSSHSIKKRPLVADLGYGLALTHGNWKFAFARYHRTREFQGQKETPVYGTFTISRKF